MWLTDRNGIRPALVQYGALSADLFRSRLTRQLFSLAFCCGWGKKHRPKWSTARGTLLPEEPHGVI